MNRRKFIEYDPKIKPGKPIVKDTRDTQKAKDDVHSGRSIN